MDRISIAKTLLKYIGRDSIENDWAIAQGVIVILDGTQSEHSQPMDVKAAPEEPKNRRKPNQSENRSIPVSSERLGKPDGLLPRSPTRCRFQRLQYTST